MRGRAREVGTSVATGGEHRVLGVEAMQRPVLETERDHPATLAVLHQQVKRKVFDEVIAVVAQWLAVERVQQGMTGSVGHTTTSVSLTTFAELERLTAKRALIDLTWQKNDKN